MGYIKKRSISKKRISKEYQKRDIKKMACYSVVFGWSNNAYEHYHQYVHPYAMNSKLKGLSQ